MRTAIILSSLLALATAAPAPRPQEIDYDGYADSVDTSSLPTGPQPGDDPGIGNVNVTTSDIIASVVDDIKSNPLDASDASAGYRVKMAMDKREVTKRAIVERDGDCSLQPTGFAAAPSPNTVPGFLANPAYASLAINAVDPSEYYQVGTNLQGSVEGIGYTGFQYIKSYDPSICAAICDDPVYHSDCQGFNLFIERDPTKDPGAACPNPAPTFNIVCTFWSVSITPAMATNLGQYRSSFQVVITASNLYAKTNNPAIVSGFQPGVALPAAINAPLAASGANTYLGYKYIPGITGTPALDLCGNLCKIQTQYNNAHPPSSCIYNKCNFFNAYTFSLNGVALGTYCSLYNAAWGPQYATNYGQTRSEGVYTITNSVSYTINGPITSTPRSNIASCAVAPTPTPTQNPAKFKRVVAFVRRWIGV